MFTIVRTVGRTIRTLESMVLLYCCIVTSARFRTDRRRDNSVIGTDDDVVRMTCSRMDRRQDDSEVGSTIVLLRRHRHLNDKVGTYETCPIHL